MEVTFLLNGYQLPMVITPEQTIADVKQAFEKTHGLSAAENGLYKAGSMLNNAKSVKDYDIAADATLHVIPMTEGDSSRLAEAETTTSEGDTHSKTGHQSSETESSMDTAGSAGTTTKHAVGSGAVAANLLSGSQRQITVNLRSSNAHASNMINVGGSKPTFQLSFGNRQPACTPFANNPELRTLAESEESESEWERRQQAQEQALRAEMDELVSSQSVPSLANHPTSTVIEDTEKCKGDIAYLCPRTKEGFQSWNEMAAHLLAQRAKENVEQGIVSKIIQSKTRQAVPIELQKENVQEVEDSEQGRLAGLITRVELLQQYVKHSKDTCDHYRQQNRDFAENGEGVFDEIYLHLKERMNQHMRSGSSMYEDEAKICDFVHQRLSEDSVAALLPALLEWVVVEQEIMVLQRLVQDSFCNDDANSIPKLKPHEFPSESHSTPESSSGVWCRHIDSDTGAEYFVHSLTQESRWDMPPPIEQIAPDLTSAIYWIRAVFINSRTGD